TLPEIGGDHFRSSAVFLTQSHPKQTEGNDVHAGTSLDQLYAKKFGQDTPIPSMQLSIENVDQAGGCTYGYSCIYTDTISWASPTQPLPMIRDPRVVFDQLFGVGATPEERAASLKADRSILDWINGQVSQLKRQLGASDRRRLDEYVENVREIERRIQRVEARNASGEQRAMPEAPIGVPDSFEEHAHILMDLIALAFAADTTRAFSFKLGRDASGRAYPESGVATGFHNASHHGEREDRIMDFAKINRYHVSMVPYLLEKLKNTPEGDGNQRGCVATTSGTCSAGLQAWHPRRRGEAVPKGCATDLLVEDYRMRRTLIISGAIGALFLSALMHAAPPTGSVADAAMQGNRDAVRALLKDGADVNTALGDGMTALHYAASKHDLEMAKILLYAGANVKATTRIGGYTPLLI